MCSFWLHLLVDEPKGCLLALLTARGQKGAPSSRSRSVWSSACSPSCCCSWGSQIPKRKGAEAASPASPSPGCSAVREAKPDITYNWKEDELIRTALALQSWRSAAVKWGYWTEIVSALTQIKASSETKPIMAFAEASTQDTGLILLNVCYQMSFSLSQCGTHFHSVCSLTHWREGWRKEQLANATCQKEERQRPLTKINTFLYLSSQFQSASKRASFIYTLSPAERLRKSSKIFLTGIYVLLW